MSQRTRVLAIFKKLHQTRKLVFTGDDRALTAGRLKINEDFKKNKELTDSEDINKLIDTATEAEKILRTEIIQGREDPKEEGSFILNIHEDVKKFDNIPYQEMPEPPKRLRRRRKDEEKEETK